MKSVQIPYDLFIDLAMYHLRGEDDYEEEIRQGLEQKLDAMLNRQLYFRYKTAPTEEEREQRGRNILTGAAFRRAIDGLFLHGSCDRSVPRSCSYKYRENFCANLIGEISLNGSLSYHRKSGNTSRLSRYACRACSRSSAVGAVLYFAYSSCRTIASNFCSNPDEFPPHNHRHRPDDTPPKLQKGHRKFVHFSYSFPFRDRRYRRAPYSSVTSQAVDSTSI